MYDLGIPGSKVESFDPASSLNDMSLKSDDVTGFLRGENSAKVHTIQELLELSKYLDTDVFRGLQVQGPW